LDVTIEFYYLIIFQELIRKSELIDQNIN